MFSSVIWHGDHPKDTPCGYTFIANNTTYNKINNVQEERSQYIIQSHDRATQYNYSKPIGQ